MRPMLTSVLLLVTAGAAASQSIPDRIAEMEATLAQLHKQRTDLESQLVALRTELGRARAEATASHDKLRQTEAMLATLEAQVATVDSRQEEVRLRQELEKLQTRLAEMTAKYTPSHPEIARLRRQIEQRRVSLDRAIAERALAREVDAVLRGAVEGRPDLAEIEIREALAKAKGVQRSQLQLRLALVLQQTRRIAEARSVLREIADGKPPYAEWAQQRLAHMDAEVADARGPQERVMEYARNLDAPRGSKKLNDAFSALHDLGPLAVPSVLAALDSLGPWGQRHALIFLARNYDARMLAAVRARLESEDPSAQVIGAEILSMLPLGTRAPLLELAGRSSHPFVLAYAARAHPQGRNIAQALAWLTRAADAGGEELNGLITQVLRDGNFRRRPQAKAIATKLLVRGAEDSVVLWVTMASPIDGGEALAVLRSLRSDEQRDGFVQAVLPQIASGHREFLIGALSEATGEHALASCLRQMIDLEGEVPIERVRELLAHHRAQVRNAAFHCLAKKAPTVLNEHAEQALAENGTWLDALGHFKEHGDARAVSAAIRACLEHRNFDRSELHAMVARRSTAQNLDDVLAWVALANYRANAAWSSRLPAVRQALHRWIGPATIGTALRRAAAVDAQVAADIVALAQHHATKADVEAVRALVNADAHEGAVSAAALPLLVRLAGRSALGDVLPRMKEARRPRVLESAWSAFGALPDDARRGTLKALMESGPSAPVFDRVLADPHVSADPGLRSAAISLLASWTGARVDARPFLGRLSATDRSELAKLLLPKCRNLEPRVVTDVIDAVASHKDALLIPAFRAALAHPDRSVRGSAAHALGRTCSLDAVKHLLDALADDQPQVVKRVEEALERIRTYHDARRRWEKWLETGEMPPIKGGKKDRREGGPRK